MFQCLMSSYCTGNISMPMKQPLCAHVCELYEDTTVLFDTFCTRTGAILCRCCSDKPESAKVSMFWMQKDPCFCMFVLISTWTEWTYYRYSTLIYSDVLMELILWIKTVWLMCPMCRFCSSVFFFKPCDSNHSEL